MGERVPQQTPVRDLSRPADVLTSGKDERRPSPFTRRRLEAVGWMLLGAAVALGGTEVRGWWEDRRLDRVLELSLQTSKSSSSYDQRRGEAELTLAVEVRNDGPRDLVVERGAAGDYVLVRSLVEVPSGEQVPLLLRRTVTCSRTAPPPAAPVDGLRLELQTAAGPRSLSLRMDPEAVGDDAARACGFLPLEEAIGVQAYETESSVGTLGLAVDLNNRSVEPATLVGLDVGQGLRAQVRDVDGGPAALPLPLPPSRPDRFQGGISLMLRVTVVDCAEARTTPPQLELQFTDGSEEHRASVDYDPASLDRLLSIACPA